MIIRGETQSRRCEVCHQADCFDPVTEKCARCQPVVDQTPIQAEDSIKPSQFLVVHSRFPSWLLGLGFIWLTTVWIVRLAADGIEHGFDSMHWLFLGSLTILWLAALALIVFWPKRTFVFDRITEHFIITKQTMAGRRSERIPFDQIRVVACELGMEGCYDVRVIFNSGNEISLTIMGHTTQKEYKRLVQKIGNIMPKNQEHMN